MANISVGKGPGAHCLEIGAGFLLASPKADVQLSAKRGQSGWCANVRVPPQANIASRVSQMYRKTADIYCICSNSLKPNGRKLHKIAAFSAIALQRSGVRSSSAPPRSPARSDSPVYRRFDLRHGLRFYGCFTVHADFSHGTVTALPPAPAFTPSCAPVVTSGPASSRPN